MSFLFTLLPFRKVTDYTTHASHSVHKQILPVSSATLFLSHVKFRDSIWQVIAPLSLKHFFIHFSVSLIFFWSPWATFSFVSFVVFFLFSPVFNIGMSQGMDFFPSLFFPSVASSRLVTSSTVWMPASQIYMSSPDLSTDIHICIFKYLTWCLQLNFFLPHTCIEL